MTQVWMIRNSDTDIHLFNRHEHLLPSVQISYSTCQNVSIEMQRSQDGTYFDVIGKRQNEDFHDTIFAKCLPVWTEPSHL